MTDSLTIAIAQLNPTMGDIAGNIGRAIEARRQVPEADLIVYPELFVCGYPPEDLVMKPLFLDYARAGVERLASETADGGPAVLIGAPWRGDDGETYNAAVLGDGGRVVTWRAKVELPNTHVFDEKRTFRQGPMPGPINVRGVRIGVPICEDIWIEEVCECLQESGAELLVTPNGSPWHIDKEDLRASVVVSRIVETGLPMLYVNQVGGQDELTFDGGSFALNADRSLAIRCASWQEQVVLTRWTRGDGGRWRCEDGPRVAPQEGMAAIYQAMICGLRDYVNKNRFPGVILGLSGGIDSALSAAVAVDALGPDRVQAVMMPSPYTSTDSLEDAAACAGFLGIRYGVVNIGPAMQAFDTMLQPLFDGAPADITEENVQSRARGVTLMALSNKFGPMVLTTGNKSEMAVGYATLYGDMCGGFSVLKDVYKTQVSALSHWRNQQKPEGGLGPTGRVMPERVITKPPSAELRPDQKDEDSLPPYAILDRILNGLIEQERSIEDLVAEGQDRDLVHRVWRLLDRAEYKRRQSPPGVKISTRAFGKERRYPITNRFHDQL
ncbi:MAG: NAD+ synthase [Alphaproteobacteria bacterium]